MSTPQQMSESPYPPDTPNCRLCNLCNHRTNVVKGEGSVQEGGLLFVGEAPSQSGDKIGRPLPPRESGLLHEALALAHCRKPVFVTTLVLCRPPDNRSPTADEVTTCVSNHLSRVTTVIRPKLIVALGGRAVCWLVNDPRYPVSLFRAKVHSTKGIPGIEGTPLVGTYHPAYLLSHPNLVPDFQHDIKKATEFVYGQAQKRQRRTAPGNDTAVN